MLIFLIASTFIVPSYMIGRYFENNSKIKELEEKLAQSRVKQNILNATQGSAENIDQDVQILKSLVPDSENYFSIIYALEELSKQTNFIITGYKINLQQGTPNKISLTITGSGDQEAFLKFLEGYNFSGGRLITADKIDFNRSQAGVSTLTLNFYSTKVSATEDQNVDYKKVLDKLAEIRPKVTVTLQGEEGIVNTYPIESNPF